MEPKELMKIADKIKYLKEVKNKSNAEIGKSLGIMPYIVTNLYTLLNNHDGEKNKNITKKWRSVVSQRGAAFRIEYLPLHREIVQGLGLDNKKKYQYICSKIGDNKLELTFRERGN